MKLLNLIKLLFKYGIDQSQYMLAHYDEIVNELIKKDRRFVWYESNEDQELSEM